MSKINKQVLMLHITIFFLAIFIVIYPYIVPFFYKTIPFWGDHTERVTGAPSAYDGITGDVKRFNYSVTHFKTVRFYNPSSFIVLHTTYANLLYRPTIIALFRKIKNHERLVKIDLMINTLLALLFMIRAFSIWYTTYYG
ncbi:hypothetical protein [Haloplasma contractile]|uniref:Uncharacterized protein n=1 Tax=Haloplasma contractile SSD-17B TaxID=1033810 RepID=F7Q0Q0_9MOLU|nr:hypothetical protein [Haloplasma contractile]ERJ11960.1 hypothetical protein HLPCO_001874 [Haloplasma contractile SSD-17B]